MSFKIPDKHKVSRADLALLPKPMSLGRLHQPLPHHDLMEAIQKQIDERFFKRMVDGNAVYDLKLELISEAHGLLSTSVGSGTELFSNLVFNVYKDRGNTLIEALNGEANYSLAVLNSNARKYALTFFPGAIIGICTNGMMIKDVRGDVVKKKHITTMSAISEIERGLQSFCDSIQIIEKVCDIMQTTYIKSWQLSEALIRFGESGTMCPSMVFKTLAEYKSKQHEDKHGTDTLWSLYNAGTEVIKESTLGVQRRVMHGMQDNFVEVDLMPSVAEIKKTIITPTLELVNN